MKKLPTKERILIEALDLFAVKGYEAVSVAEIAEAVGIKAPSLYKHYKNKQDIFDAILIEMDRRYKEQVSYLNMDGTDAKVDLSLFASVSESHLIEMGKKLFLYFLHDEYVSKFRKMLTIEQYRNHRLADLLAEQYIEAPLSYQGMMFGLLSSGGILKQRNPKIMAFHFYAPLYLMLTLCDCPPEREQEMLSLLEEHMKQFNDLYQKEGGSL